MEASKQRPSNITEYPLKENFLKTAESSKYCLQDGDKPQKDGAPDSWLESSKFCIGKFGAEILFSCQTHLIIMFQLSNDC